MEVDTRGNQTFFLYFDLRHPISIEGDEKDYKLKLKIYMESFSTTPNLYGPFKKTQ